MKIWPVHHWQEGLERLCAQQNVRRHLRCLLQQFRPELEGSESRALLEAIALETGAGLTPDTAVFAVGQRVTMEEVATKIGGSGTTTYPVRKLIFSAAPAGTTNYQTQGTRALASPPGGDTGITREASLSGAFSATGTCQIPVKYARYSGGDPPWEDNSTTFRVPVPGVGVPDVAPTDYACDSTVSLLGSALNAGVGGRAGGNPAGSSARGAGNSAAVPGRATGATNSGRGQRPLRERTSQLLCFANNFD